MSASNGLSVVLVSLSVEISPGIPRTAASNGTVHVADGFRAPNRMPGVSIIVGIVPELARADQSVVVTQCSGFPDEPSITRRTDWQYDEGTLQKERMNSRTGNLLFSLQNPENIRVWRSFC